MHSCKTVHHGVWTEHQTTSRESGTKHVSEDFDQGRSSWWSCSHYHSILSWDRSFSTWELSPVKWDSIEQDGTMVYLWWGLLHKWAAPGENVKILPIRIEQWLSCAEYLWIEDRESASHSHYGDVIWGTLDTQELVWISFHNSHCCFCMFAEAEK